ncbi:DUF6463 family protein [Cellulosimicrobium protaetiae]|uniref:Uncharacterized protein n=1 Tax=Cellulosimicrobium protaetiae TaxID=2587808 RepID=A0A6M5UGX3_9MICO|nr:DUF6463 family protein [Cellulosimicrobium protaetiae]QJW35889.1 hypothetical protein FIC82_006445 [Cellulosimicrobium protaetiae]
MTEAPSTARRTARVAAGTLVALGSGHLAVVTTVGRDRLAAWADSGLWAAVPLFPGPDPSATTLQDQAAFWSGVGSFAVPLVALGGLVWWLAGKGTIPPTPLGWALVAWFAVGAIVLVPSPMILGALAGALLVVAARLSRPRSAPRGRRTSSSRP